ncbi:hypothetical protein EK21DRAFT_94700 [Setomelanomma holmii]|uniref:Uncharacterized protein n=1 Tax=Setomelanomma holmii TaxID=210430 RepID=A0A9P4GY97_9PLEO|nr:hypothetical protein EK21DRAFT_94700 [Setomelanomma holmii]
MQFLFQLLLCTQSVLATLASSYDPNKWGRGVGESRYTVHATDPTKTTETDALLKSSFGANNVITNQLDNDIATWIITSHGDELTDPINQLDVVRVGDPKTVPQTQSSEPRRRRGRRDDGVCIAVPVPGSDLNKVEDFIQSKVQPGTDIARITNGNRITAWYGLHLGPEAKDAVENFEGVEEVEAEMETNYNRALPVSRIVLGVQSRWQGI